MGINYVELLEVLIACNLLLSMFVLVFITLLALKKPHCHIVFHKEATLTVRAIKQLNWPIAKIKFVKYAILNNFHFSDLFRVSAQKHF